jgi:SAM-dependent methyltransferase
MTKIDHQEDAYFEALGKPKPDKPYDALEQYRFWLVYQHLARGSVLDVGVYYGDFLKLALQDGRTIMGTEVNEVRVDLANSLLGKDVVVQDFRNGTLSQFDDDCVDNGVAMEVVEHVSDVKTAVDELCRVARRRVIITVPLRQEILTVLCIHCNKYTPYSGHLHSFDYGAFSQLAPPPWRVSQEIAFGNHTVRRLSPYLPNNQSSMKVMRLLDGIAPGEGFWLLAVLEPHEV